jgi:CheY-like chemotaxis protein
VALLSGKCHTPIKMKEKILLMVVNDDPGDRALFADAVQEVGEDIICITENCGAGALERLRDVANELPHFIFLDLRMPCYSGKECLQAIKSDERLREIPVIVYATSRGEEDEKELKALGAAHFFSKPSDPEEVYYVVAHTLEEQLKLRKKVSNS